MGGQSELSPEELFLLTKHDILAAKQKELDELKAQYRRIQEERKRQKCLAESPSQATEIAKKLAASGKLITAKAGNKTSGFKRMHANNFPQKLPPPVKPVENSDSTTVPSDTKTTDIEKPAMGKPPVKKEPVVFKSAGLLNDLEPSEKPVEPRVDLDLDDDDDLFNDQPFKFAKYDGNGQSYQNTCSFDDLLHSRNRNETNMNSERPKDSWKNNPKRQSNGSPNKRNNQSPHSLARAAPEKGNTIFIGNSGLPSKVLHRLADPFGSVHKIDFDKAKKAFVTFTSFEAAEKAISALNGLELTAQHFGDEIASFATVDKTKLFVNYAKMQRYKHIVQDLKNDWARISAGVKVRPGLGSKVTKKSNDGEEAGSSADAGGEENAETERKKARKARVYDEEDPFYSSDLIM